MNIFLWRLKIFNSILANSLLKHISNAFTIIAKCKLFWEKCLNLTLILSIIFSKDEGINFVNVFTALTPLLWLRDLIFTVLKETLLINIKLLVRSCCFWNYELFYGFQDYLKFWTSNWICCVILLKKIKCIQNNL